MPGGDVPYVPDTSDYAIPYKDQITIEQLLQHTAGVYDVDNSPVPGCEGNNYVEWMLEQNPDHQFTNAEQVRQDAIHQLSYFAPGTDYHYSDTGYTLLAEIIGRVYTYHSETKKNYSDFIMEYLMGVETPYPLAMAFPYLATDQTMPTPYVCGMVFSPEGDEIYCRDNMSAFPANGNGVGTMRQLNTFVRTVMRGENVLIPESVSLMQHDTSTYEPSMALAARSGNTWVTVTKGTIGATQPSRPTILKQRFQSWRCSHFGMSAAWTILLHVRIHYSMLLSRPSRF